MRIGIDARALEKSITGTGRYLLNLLTELPNIDKKNEYFLFTRAELSLDKNFYKVISPKRSFLPMKIYSPFWLNFTLPKLIRKYKIDLLFSSNILIPIINLGNVKCVSVIHDAIPWIYKEYYPFFYKKYLYLFVPPSIKKSNIVITVSEQSKRDLIKYCNVPDEKIRVVYNTAANYFKPNILIEKNDPVLQKKITLPDKYLLYVGAVEKRKNILGLIKIIDLLNEKGSQLQLVIIGKPGYDFGNIIPEIKKRKGLIKYFRFIDDETLSYIYNNTFVFIFPSFYEGFGIPPLEAMQCGIPVLSSNTPSLVEVVGDGGLLHNPNDYEGFVEDILKLENDQDFYNSMKIKALEQSQKFNIKETTQKMVNIFNEFQSN